MSFRQITKKRKYGVFLFPEERTVRHAPTANIINGDAIVGSTVVLQWEEEAVPAKILRLAGKFSKPDKIPTSKSLPKKNIVDY